MRMIIHDLSEKDFEALDLKQDTDIIVSDNGTIKKCVGCFGCWIKTPGVCVLRDEYQDMGENLAACDELIIISQCVYGSDSPFIRTVWNRSISYFLPYFVTKNGESHHKARYNKKIAYSAYFYGENITAREKETAKSLVHANAINFYAYVNYLSFSEHFQDIKKELAK